MGITKQTITAIEHAQIVLENGILWDGVLIVEGDRIREIGHAREVTIPYNAIRINAEDAYVGPGFVDIHVHGGNGYTTYFEPEQAAEFFLHHGTTTILATPSYDLPFHEFMEAIYSAKMAIQENGVIRGFYMEGPYMNPEYGSHAYENPWRAPIEQEQFKALVNAAGKDVKVWAIAPEREGILPFLEYARKINPEVVFAVGHSEATPGQIHRLGRYRPMLQTHAMNATGRVAVYGGTRGYGPDEYCMKEPDVYTELISDSCGIHVHPAMQQLLLYNKGVHRIILITDSTVYDEPSPVGLAYIKDLNFDAHGGIAGSRMTMELACRNIMTHTNCGIAQAFLMASRNPARIIGLEHEIGTIEAGKRANLVFVDDKFQIQKVMLNGKIVVSE